MTEYDKRRTPYVPLDVLIAFGDFGTKLIHKWGMEGIAGWMLFLAACKREPIQGRMTFTSDLEFWTKLGARATAYSSQEFLTFTGHHKKTSRTRHGRVTYVDVTRWEEWNTPPPSGRSPRKTQEITKKIPENTREIPENTSLEVEVEVEREVEDCSTRAKSQRLYRLPRTAEIELEVQKLLKLGGCDDQSEGVLRSYAKKLSLQTVADIRSRAQQSHKRVGWAVRAMQKEIEERSAA